MVADTLYTKQEYIANDQYTSIQWNIQSPHDSLVLRVNNFPYRASKNGELKLLGKIESGVVCIEIYSTTKKVLCNKG